MSKAAVDFASLDAIASDLSVTFVLVASAAIVAIALIVAGAIALSRRRRKDAQEIVMLLEEMRSGRVRTRLELDPRSPLAPIAESANRLGQDLGVRWSRAEVASEGFYALQDAARGYAVISTDSDGDLRALSPGAGQLFGWEEDAVVGRNAALLFDEASWRELLPKLARKSLRERGVETRALMVKADGSRFHARLLVRILRGHADEPSGFLLVIQDVSEQVLVENELRASEKLSRGLIEDLPAGVAVVQRDRIVYANPQLRALLALGDFEVAGFALRDRIATSHVLIVQDALERLEFGGGETTFEASVGLLDAEGRGTSEVRLVAVAHTHAGRPAVLVMLRDETAERRLVRTLAAEEARLDAVLEAWEDGVLLIEEDASGARVRLANRSFLSMFSLTRQRVAGISEAELLDTLRAQGSEGIAAASCLAAASTGPAYDVVPATDRALTFWATRLTDARSASSLRMLAVRDVTSQQAATTAHEDEIARWRSRHESAVASYATLHTLHDELTARRDEAERLNAELRTLDGMKSDLLANVSHELQTPLVSIRGYTEMILKGRLGTINDEQKKGLTLSLRNIDRLIAMIDNLLAFARMDRESGAMKVATFALSAIVDEALALLGPRIEAKSLTVTRQAGDPTLVVRADRDKILQVFLNVIGNAVKFNREGGSIEISARPGKPGYALVSVRDTGMGIAKDDLEKVFDRFYQADAGAAPKGEGTGIGLAIVRNILRLHGCVVHATSEPGEGTVLSFTLPLAEGRAEAAGVARAPSDPQPPPPPQSEPRHEPRSEPPPGPQPERPPENNPAPRPQATIDRPKLRIIRRS